MITYVHFQWSSAASLFTHQFSKEDRPQKTDRKMHVGSDDTVTVVRRSGRQRMSSGHPHCHAGSRILAKELCSMAEWRI